MYKVMKAVIVQGDKPVKAYDLDMETEDLNAVRADILNRYGEQCKENTCVHLQYKEIE